MVALLSIWIAWLLVGTSRAEEQSLMQQHPSEAPNNDSTNESHNNEHPISTDAHILRMVSWVREEGGFVSNSLEIRRVNVKDPDSTFGVFAKTGIAEGDLLFSIPRSCILGEIKEEGWICDTTQTLVHEMEKGERSLYAPYIDYLLQTQPQGLLPSHWSEAGKTALLRITGGTRYADDQVLPPMGPVGWIDHEYKVDCGFEDTDPMHEHAFLLTVQRNAEDVLIPMFDMLNHRNGPFFNTKRNSVQEGGDIQVFASQLIKAGSEIYTSYNQCAECGDRRYDYGVGEMLRDFGFVESMPQTWSFQDQSVGFTLNEHTLSWTTNPPSESTISFFEEQLERLEELKEEQFLDANKDIPQNEWDMLLQYHNALTVALERVIEHSDEDACLAEDTPGDRRCRISNKRYDSLADWENDYHQSTCDTSIQQDFDSYDDTEEVISPYQVISFFEHPETRDTCFDLDNVYQICSSYRPHYHEAVVHYTARFLPRIERVLWVGGGDSMLLSEILKYPSLELVIGLELDGKVTRHSFKHFGTQPHWDNDLVQWWYGNAALSLRLLPKELFGSFDLVLVDLSETVMSAKVTKGLDILSALSLLLKPEGIFVKNELYFEKLSSIFKHTIQVHMYSFPVICSQALSLGSNALDFTQATITDHKVPTLFNQLDDVDQHFSVVHDYEMNPGAQQHCLSSEDQEEPTEQEESFGIVLILEAENTTISLETGAASVLASAIEVEGFTIVSSHTTPTEHGSITTFVLQEGYVVGRSWNQHAYCALDIHLFSSFSKLEALEKGLLLALGSQSSSSFRIVGGGMFGVAGWAEDQKSRGPKFTQDCERTKLEQDAAQTDSLDENMTADILNEMATLLTKRTSALVVCGAKHEICGSLKLTTTDLIYDVVPLWTCSSIEGAVEYQPDSAKRKLECEKQVLVFLKELASGDNDKLGLVIFDQNAGFSMAQVVHKIFSRGKNRRLVLEEDVMVLAPSMTNSPDTDRSWRNVFVHKLHELMPDEPSFVAKLLFNTTKRSTEMNVLMTGSSLFVKQLAQVTRNLKDRNGVTGEVRTINGGTFRYQEDFVPEQFFKPSDYDQREPYKQWVSQNPCGLQTLFQMEVEDSSTLSKEVLWDLLNTTLVSMEIPAIIEHFTLLGEGSIVSATWKEGSIVLLYDGRKHVDINLFTYKEDVSLATSIAEKLAPLKTILRDEMPRGFGRVVSMKKDLEPKPRKTPTWALDIA